MNLKAIRRLEAMLKHSRKRLLQRKHKPRAKHAGDTFKTPNASLSGLPREGD